MGCEPFRAPMEMSEPTGRLKDMIFLIHTAILLVSLIFFAMSVAPVVAEKM